MLSISLCFWILFAPYLLSFLTIVQHTGLGWLLHSSVVAKQNKTKQWRICDNNCMWLRSLKCLPCGPYIKSLPIPHLIIRYLYYIMLLVLLLDTCNCVKNMSKFNFFYNISNCLQNTKYVIGFPCAG